MHNLTLITFLPALGALIVALLPNRDERVLRGITLFVTSVVAVLGVSLFCAFDGSQAALQFTQSVDWFTLGATSVHYEMGVDGISILLITLTAILMPFVALSSPGHITERTREFLVWLLLMETGMLGVFASADLVLFYFFWEVSLVPLYFILGIWGGHGQVLPVHPRRQSPDAPGRDRPDQSGRSRWGAQHEHRRAHGLGQRRAP